MNSCATPPQVPRAGNTMVKRYSSKKIIESALRIHTALGVGDDEVDVLKCFGHCFLQQFA